MKKHLSLVIALVIMLCLTACTGNKSKTDGETVDVKYYADLGQINGVDYKLGDSVETVKQKLEAAAQSSSSEDEEGFFYDYQSGDYTVLTDGTVCCCYKTEKPEDGITHIVKYGEAYGFKQGSVSIEVSDAMSKAGFSTKERDAASGELFFLPSGTGSSYSVLQYDFNKNSVLFVFDENTLSAAVISAK